MTQEQIVIQTLERLDGIATLSQLNKEVPTADWKTKTPFASIRRIVQVSKEIFKIKPGLWALKSYQSKLEAKGAIPTKSNQDSPARIEFNHSYYQGVLLLIGNQKKLNTFVPNQDKNKLFGAEKLGDIRTLSDVPKFSYDNFVRRISTVDVIWFNDRQMPHSLFEVEHTTDIQNSLLKYADLQDFNMRFVIVADEKRRDEFNKKIAYSAFKSIQKRVHFLSYSNVESQFEGIKMLGKSDFVL